MGTKREKKKVLAGVTREQADEAFAAYAKASAEYDKLSADLELKAAQLREKYADRLSGLGAEGEERVGRMQAWATEHRSELFGKRKSLDTVHGTLGFRTGTPKLKTTKGFTWAIALEKVKQYLPQYIRTTEEVAKDKLLADRDLQRVAMHALPEGTSDIEAALFYEEGGIRHTGMSHAMSLCGLQVVQEESFYVELKQEGGHE